MEDFVRTVHVINSAALIIYPNEKYWAVCREGNDSQWTVKEMQGPGSKVRALNYRLLKKGTTILKPGLNPADGLGIQHRQLALSTVLVPHQARRDKFSGG